MLKNRSLNAKILAGFLVVCFGFSIGSITSYFSMQKVVKTYNKLAEVSVPNLGHISGMRNRGRQMQAEVIKLALFWDQEEEIKKTLESLAHAIKRYEAITEEYLAAPFSPGEEEIYKNIDAKYAPIKAKLKIILDLQASSDPDKVSKIKSMLLDFENDVRDHQKALLALDDYHVELGTQWSKESQALSTKTNNITVIVSLISLIMGIGIALFLSKSINNILKGLADRLMLSSEKVAANSHSVKQASQDLSDGSTEQAASLHETVASTNEISIRTQKTSQNSEISLQKAELSRDASTKGQVAIDQMLKAIVEIGASTKAINEQFKVGNEEIQQIVNHIIHIGEKTKLIDDIVFQTKLLSFNVSVEAARAGEHGKGFAVVAEQMTNLANMSGIASKEISEMLAQTTEKAMKVVDNNKTNIEKLLVNGEQKVKDGQVVATDCKNVLNKILTYVDEMCSIIKEMSLSTEEQAKGISEINKAMEQLDSCMAQNTQASQQCADAAIYLMDEVEQTRKIVQDLFRTIHGKVDEHSATVTELHAETRTHNSKVA